MAWSRPLVRGRGLKQLVIHLMMAMTGRPLVRGRGLKLFICGSYLGWHESPACTGAWIETSFEELNAQHAQVARLYGGVD